MYNKKWPAVFTGHGYPMNAITDNPARRGWADAGRKIGRPQVIIAMTSHFEGDGTCVHVAPDNPQLFDIVDLPEEIYNVKYKPLNSPEYARKVLEMIGDNAFPDNTWGIDHALWTTLSNMFPEADIPVVVISTDTGLSPEEMYGLGRRLKPLREDGALLFATGNIVHNVDMVDHDFNGAWDWAWEFDEAVRRLVEKRDIEALLKPELIRNHELALPTLDHYYPLLFILGASDENDELTVFNEYCELASLSMTSYLFC